MKYPDSPLVKLLPLWLLGFSFLSALAVSVHAEKKFTGTYLGFQYSNLKTEVDDSVIVEKDSSGHIKGKYGWVMNDVISLEGQLGFSTDSDANEGLATYGMYLRANKDISNYRIYGLIGLGGYRQYFDNDPSISESGASYGLGVEILGSDEVALSLEYVSIFDDTVSGDDITVNTLGLGFTYYFTVDDSYFGKNRDRIKSIRY